MSSTPRVLIAGVGYRNLRDYSAGIEVQERLEALTLPPHIVVEDLSYSPVAVSWWLQEEAIANPFERAIFVAAAARGIRSLGSFVAYRWDGVLPPPEEVQRAVVDAVTGVIDLDNTLVVTRQLGGLPNDIIVLEVEPLLHEFGDGFSAPVEHAVNEMCSLAIRFATDPRAVAALPLAALGGVTATPVGRS